MAISFDPITYSAVLQKGSAVRRIEPVMFSATVTAQKDGYLQIRAMGAGGGGAKGSNARGGNGGTVAKKYWMPVKEGDSFVVTIPAGGAGKSGSAGDGLAGGTLTVVKGGVTLLSIPGGTGGVDAASAPGDNTAPTGADWYVLGGKAGNGVASGGGGAMIVEGGSIAGHGGDANYSGGGGALGNASAASGGGGGGSTNNAIGVNGGTGVLTPEISILLISNTASGLDSADTGASVGIGGGANGGGGGSSSGYVGGGGGFGGGGGGSSGGGGGGGGFGGGGGGGGSGGAGGFGGGGGGSGGTVGGSGGQGFATFEWLENWS